MKSDPRPPEPPQPPPAGPPVSRQTILVVDDQAANIQTIGVLLASLGYDVMAATGAIQALERIAARTPDLILLDMMMPGISGLDLCRILRDDPVWREIPIIFLSAASEVNMITSALDSGAVDYVTKPFHRTELISRLRTHLALKSTRDELREALTDKDELLGLMAHDLKNRLAALQFHGEFLNSEPGLSPQAARCAATISREARVMSDCIREMLANQYADRRGLHPEPVDPVEIASAVTASMEPIFHAKGQQLTTVPGKAPPVCMADRQALRQVLENLLSNASKFSPPKSAISLRIEGGNQGCTISVRNEGAGFTEEDKERVFKRYGRLSAQPTAGESSTGLGLHIVKTLVAGMGGSVSLVSAPGEGAEFNITLPLPPG